MQVMFAMTSKSLENSVELVESYTVTSETSVAINSVGNWASGLKLTMLLETCLTQSLS